MSEAAPYLQPAAAPPPATDGDFVNRLRELALTTRRPGALLVRFSAAHGAGRRPEVVRAALRPLEALAKVHGGSLYRMANGDVVLVCETLPLERVDPLLFRLRTLLDTGPVLWSTPPASEAGLIGWFDLSRSQDLKRLIATVGGGDHAREQGQKAGRDTPAVRPLDPGALDDIQRQLIDLPLKELVRQQAALAIAGPDAFHPLFVETYVSMAALRARVAPDVDLLSNPWLFRTLTETLDVRMLDLAASPAFAAGPAPLSLNLNLRSFATVEFSLFVDVLAKAKPGTTIEVQLVDVLADMAVFSEVAEIPRRHGVRILIDGITPGSVDCLDVAALNADRLKILWNRETAEANRKGAAKALAHLVDRRGRDAVILARVDSGSALEWGLAAGVRQFQGFFLDRLTAALARKAE